MPHRTFRNLHGNELSQPTFSGAMGKNGFDFSNEATLQAMGQALRATHEVDTALPDHLAKLMQELQRRLDQPKDEGMAASAASPKPAR